MTTTCPKSKKNHKCPVFQWVLNRWVWALPPLLRQRLELNFYPVSWWVTCLLQPAHSPARSAFPRLLSRAQVHIEVGGKALTIAHQLITVYSKYCWFISAFAVYPLGGAGSGSGLHPVVPTPKDKSGAPPVRSIHHDLVTVGTPLSAHRQVSMQAFKVSNNCQVVSMFTVKKLNVVFCRWWFTLLWWVSAFMWLQEQMQPGRWTAD